MKAKQLAILSASTTAVAPASAMIIHTPLSQPFAGSEIYFSLSEQWWGADSSQTQGGDWFQLNTDLAPDKPQIFATNSGEVAQDINNYYYAVKFTPGSPVDNNQTFASSATFLNQTNNNDANWAAGTRGFIGLKIFNNSTDKYGWADIEYANDFSFVLYGFAYDNSGASIAAGAIPEPNATGLLAALAAGSAAMLGRRRRAVANAE